ncbi:MAG: hypothetical protein ABR575_01955 [Actinomycetota bacterium]
MTATPRFDARRTTVAARRVLLLVGALAFAAFVAGWAALALRNDRPDDPVTGIVMPCCFMGVGSLIAARRPENSMGWIFIAIALVFPSGALASEYVVYSVRVEPLPAVTLAAWYGEWYWIVFLFLMLSGMFLLFPTGRLPAGRWRLSGRAIAIGAAVLIVLAMLDPVLDAPGTSATFPNPVGISPLGDPEAPPAGPFFVAFALYAIVSSLLALILRFRRSRGDERQQLKWFVYAATVFGLGFIGLGVVDALTGTRPPLDGVIMSLPPIAAGVAILKYRLYDIDLLINRTLVYGSLSAILALVYVGLVTGISSLAGDSPVTVAAATLAVAALFQPLRRAVQGFIDRRFYRSKYDAQRTIERFSARLRDEVSLDSLSEHLLEVVQDTMQPARLSLWLRPAEDRTAAR